METDERVVGSVPLVQMIVGNAPGEEIVVDFRGTEKAYDSHGEGNDSAAQEQGMAHGHSWAEVRAHCTSPSNMGLAVRPLDG